MAEKLTPKQKRFCDEYLIDLNATQAYLRAGYKVSETVAGVNANRLLKNAKIAPYIAQRQADLQKKTEITQEKVLQELAKIGFADIKQYLEFKTVKTPVVVDGEKVLDYMMIVDAKDSNEVDGAAIAEVSIGKDGTFKLKLHDKLSALDKLGKHLGLFEKGSSAMNDGEDDPLTAALKEGLENGIL